MAYHEYKVSQEISKSDPPFYALIMSAMRKADSTNIEKLKLVFPDTFNELQERYNAPGGKLEGEN